jgi:hypothetical protein
LSCTSVIGEFLSRRKLVGEHARSDAAIVVPGGPALESANRPAQMASRDSVGGLVSQAPVKARLSWVREVMSSLVKTLPR